MDLAGYKLLEWVKEPVTNANIGNVTALQCSTPVVDAKICNGMPTNEQGFLLNCPFIDFPWYEINLDGEMQRNGGRPANFLVAVASQDDVLRVPRQPAHTAEPGSCSEHYE